MVVYIIFLVAAMVMAVCGVLDWRHNQKMKELYRSQFRPYVSDFSVYKYMDRIEKAGIEIMAEEEKRQEYQLVLWAGLDGLRMNQDGTTEWIRREEEKQKPISVSYSPCQSLVQEPAQNTINIIQKNTTQQTDNQWRIFALRQQLQKQQMQNMINAIQPAYGPQYIQFMNQYWPSPYSQCAVHQGWMTPQ